MQNTQENQYQHGVPQILQRNFSEDRIHINKCENGSWSKPKISETGGANLLYGLKDNSLEKFFGRVETAIANVIEERCVFDKKHKAYMKLFILVMAYRSISKNKIIMDMYNSYIQPNKDISKEEMSLYNQERIKNTTDWLLSFSIDEDMKNIIRKLPKSFKDISIDDSYAVIVKELLFLLPFISDLFKIQIFASDFDLIIGETSTVSVNLDTNRISTNGEEAGLKNKNVMYWLPLTHRKIVFMYKRANIRAINDRRLRKCDADILNYFQTKKSDYYYSMEQDIEIPKLQPNFVWIKDFNYIFGYKHHFTNQM